MSYLNWHVGMKVVFIGWPCGAHDAGLADPFVKNRVYAVEEIKLLKEGSDIVANGQTFELPQDTVYIRVIGLLVMAEAFRPVQPRQTDISIFTQMLNPSKINVGEPA